MRCVKHPEWGDSTCLPCIEEAQADELARLKARVAELEAAIARHRDSTIVKRPNDGLLWSVLEP